MKFKNELIFRYSIALILAAGLLWTALNIMRADELRQKTRGKIGIVKQLWKLKDRQDFIEASFNTLAVLPSNTATTLTALASSSVTGSVAKIRDIDSRTLGRGWSANRTEVTFHEINLNAIADFLHAAETRHPPWRLTECVITSSQKTNGIGNAKLIMETVTRTDTKP